MPRGVAGTRRERIREARRGPVCTTHASCRRHGRRHARCMKLVRGVEDQVHGEIRPESIQEGREGDARAKARNAAKRALREEGEEPQTGDRDRPLRGAPRRRQGSEAEVVFAASILVAAADRPRGPFSVKSVCANHPPHIAGRFIAQRGCFTAHPIDFAQRPRWDSDLICVTIPAGHRDEIRDGLRTLGIDRASLFPGLGGIASSIRAHMCAPIARAN